MQQLRFNQRPQAALQILHTSIFYENFLLGFMPFFKQAVFVASPAVLL